MTNAIPTEAIEGASETHQKHIKVILGHHEVDKVQPFQDTEGALATKLYLADGRVATVLTTFSPTVYGVPGFDTKVEWE